MVSEMKKLTSRAAHHHAWLCANFMWQDDYAEGKTDGCGEVVSTATVGTLPEEQNGSPVFIIHVNGVVESDFGYSYEVERTIKVYQSAEGEPVVGEATEEEIEAAEQHTLKEAEEEYTALMRLISVGAYDERRSDGSWGEDGIERRVHRLDRWAIEDGMFFAKHANDTYALEPAPLEMLKAFEEAQAEEDEEDDEV